MMLSKGMKLPSLITDNYRSVTVSGGFLKGRHPEIEDGVVDQNVRFWYEISAMLESRSESRW